MKIAIDARMIGWTGIGRVTRRLLDELQKIDRHNQYLVLLMPDDMPNWKPTADNFKPVKANFRPYSLAEQWGYWRFLRELKPDLVHFMGFNLPILYGGRYAVTINDLTLIEYPTIGSGRWPRPVYYLRHWAMLIVLSVAVRRAKAVITISRFVKRQLVKRYHLKEDRVVVTHLGVDRPEAVESEAPRNIKPPFLLYVGNPYPHKNLGRLLEAFKLMLDEVPALRLVIVSNTRVGNTLPFYNQLRAQAKSLGIDRAVVFPEFVSDEGLAWLFQQTELFVFPSLSEGFGLPPLEAMAMGTPVISSSATSLPEVLGDAAAYFDANNPADMANKTLAVLHDPALLDRLAKAGPKQAAGFSWAKTAEQTLATYKSLQQ